mgnify:CR=1 FL=1
MARTASRAFARAPDGKRINTIDDMTCIEVGGTDTHLQGNLKPIVIDRYYFKEDYYRISSRKRTHLVPLRSGGQDRHPLTWRSQRGAPCPGLPIGSPSPSSAKARRIGIRTTTDASTSCGCRRWRHAAPSD